MKPSRAELAQHIDLFLGLTCRKATTGLAQTLGLWFEAPDGWKDEDRPPMIQTHSSAWRIVKAGTVLAGQYDDEDHGRTMEPALGELKGRVLRGVELHLGLPDARFTFSDDLVVEFFTNGRDVKAWEAFLPAAKWIEIGPGVAWREVASDDPCADFTAEERRFSDHARAFGQRWRGRMPPPSPWGRRCSSCAHWRSLTGGFDYWDFGVCSNARSGYDGTLVSREMGCRRFSLELEQPVSGSE